MLTKSASKTAAAPEPTPLPATRTPWTMNDPGYLAAVRQREFLQAKIIETDRLIAQQIGLKNQSNDKGVKLPSRIAGLLVGGKEPEQLGPQFEPLKLKEYGTAKAEYQYALTEQEKIITAKHHAASVRICQEAAPEFKALIHNLVKAIRMAISAAKAIDAFKLELSQNNVELCAPVTFNNIDHHDGSQLARFINTAGQAGLIAGDNIGMDQTPVPPGMHRVLLLEGMSGVRVYRAPGSTYDTTPAEAKRLIDRGLALDAMPGIVA